MASRKTADHMKLDRRTLLLGAAAALVGAKAGLAAPRGRGQGSAAGRDPADRRALLAQRNGFAAPVAEGAEGWPDYVVTSNADGGPGSLRDALESPRPCWISFVPSLDGFNIIFGRQVLCRPNKVVDGRGSRVRIGGFGSDGILYDGRRVGTTANLVFAYCQFEAQTASANSDMLTFYQGSDLVWLHHNVFGPGGSRDSYFDFTKSVWLTEIGGVDPGSGTLGLAVDGIATGDCVQVGGDKRSVLPGGTAPHVAYWAERLRPGLIRLYRDPALSVPVALTGPGAGGCQIGKKVVSRFTVDWNVIMNNPGAQTYPLGDRITKGSLVGLDNPGNAPNDQGMFRDGLRGTYHHNLWQHIVTRQPNIEAGLVHLYNNVHLQWGEPDGKKSNVCGVASDGQFVVENCVFTPYSNGDTHWFSEYERARVPVVNADKGALSVLGHPAAAVKALLLWSGIRFDNGARVERRSNPVSAATQGILRASYRVAAVEPGSGLLTVPNHNWNDGHPVEFASTGRLPGGLEPGGAYWARVIDADRIEVHDRPDFSAASPVRLSGAGSGVHTVSTRPFQPSDHYRYGLDGASGLDRLLATQAGKTL